jgi:transcriptional/translational regulatory protein YebC/TACO1
MAGHSKWANIKHKKARTDEKRGKAFTNIYLFSPIPVTCSEVTFSIANYHLRSCESARSL